MSIVAFASLKGSPGVTTLACLVAASWPEGLRPVVVECDPAGGDLGPRFGLTARSGWVTLVATARREAGELDLEPHLQQLPGGLEVLVAATGREPTDRGRTAREGAERSLRTYADTAELIIDLGRLEVDLAAADPWLGAADVVCIVVRSEPAPIMHLRDRVEELRRHCGGELVLVVVEDGTYRPEEIAGFTGLEVVGVVPFDAGTASVATTGNGSRRRLERSGLAAAARRLAVTLAERSAAPAAPTAPTAPAAPEPLVSPGSDGPLPLAVPAER